MVKKLPYRHHAYFIFARYKAFVSLVRQKQPVSFKYVEGKRFVVWHLGDDLEIGLYLPIAEIVFKHGHATQAFYDEILPVLYKLGKTETMNMVGVLYPENEEFLKAYTGVGV